MNRPIHFEILATDPEKAVAFYKEVLGWEFASWEGPQSYWLITTGADEATGINGGLMHRHLQQAVINTIEVASLDETIARVKAAGGKLVHGPDTIPGVGTHAYCQDPEGIYFGLLQPVATT